DAGAPEDISVYTDGGLAHRPDSPAALGNWGRAVMQHLQQDATALLERSGWAERAPTSTTFWGQLDGPAISSTRSEAWAIAAAHLLPIPLQLGVDNKGAVSILDKMLKG
ncbi:MAG: hypothetical protein ACKPKO_45790, partial [Candidatus Fonsibacter sp.]